MSRAGTTAALSSGLCLRVNVFGVVYCARFPSDATLMCLLRDGPRVSSLKIQGLHLQKNRGLTDTLYQFGCLIVHRKVSRNLS